MEHQRCCHGENYRQQQTCLVKSLKLGRDQEVARGVELIFIQAKALRDKVDKSGLNDIMKHP
jgi:hypothetical protein